MFVKFSLPDDRDNEYNEQWWNWLIELTDKLYPSHSWLKSKQKKKIYPTDTKLEHWPLCSRVLANCASSAWSKYSGPDPPRMERAGELRRFLRRVCGRDLHHLYVVSNNTHVQKRPELRQPRSQKRKLRSSNLTAICAAARQVFSTMSLWIRRCFERGIFA